MSSKFVNTGASTRVFFTVSCARPATVALRFVHHAIAASCPSCIIGYPYLQMPDASQVVSGTGAGTITST